MTVSADLEHAGDGVARTILGNNLMDFPGQSHPYFKDELLIKTYSLPRSPVSRRDPIRIRYDEISASRTAPRGIRAP